MGNPGLVASLKQDPKRNTKEEKMKSRMFGLIIASLASLLVSVNASYAGSVKQYQVPAGEAIRNISVYLPEGYDESGASYPVLYLLHGLYGDDRTFFGASGSLSNANVSFIVDRLVQEGKVSPLIVACPALGLDEDVLRYFVPFVDATLRTIPKRESRAIAGHSAGGYDALFIALAHPEAFSIAGGFSVWAPSETTAGELIKTRDLKSNPILFWLYAGTQDDGAAKQNSHFVDFLRANGLDTTYTEDDGNHANKVAERLSEFIEFLSKTLKW
jgi:enterochelin esterase-like enzyme